VRKANSPVFECASTDRWHTIEHQPSVFFCPLVSFHMPLVLSVVHFEKVFFHDTPSALSCALVGRAEKTLSLSSAVGEP